MTNVSKVCITDPFLDLWAPSGGPQKAIMKAKKSPSGTPKGSKNACIGSKMRFTCGGHLDGVFWTESGQFGPSNDHFRGGKAIIGTIWGLK